MLDQLQSALELVYQASTPHQLRRQAEEKLELAKKTKDSWMVFLQLLELANTQETKFFCMLVLEEGIRSNQADANLVWSHLERMINEGRFMEDANFCHNKLGQLMVLLLTEDNVDVFLKHLVRLVDQMLPHQVEFFLIVMKALNDEFVDKVISRTTQQIQQHQRLKDKLREEAIASFVQVWYNIVRKYYWDNALVSKVLVVVSLYISWIDIMLMNNWIELFFQMLQTAELQEQTIHCIQEIVMKGMPFQEKMQIFEMYSIHKIIELDQTLCSKYGLELLEMWLENHVVEERIQQLFPIAFSLSAMEFMLEYARFLRKHQLELSFDYKQHVFKMYQLAISNIKLYEILVEIDSKLSLDVIQVLVYSNPTTALKLCLHHLDVSKDKQIVSLVMQLRKVNVPLFMEICAKFPLFFQNEYSLICDVVMESISAPVLSSFAKYQKQMGMQNQQLLSQIISNLHLVTDLKVFEVLGCLIAMETDKKHLLEMILNWVIQFLEPKCFECVADICNEFKYSMELETVFQSTLLQVIQIQSQNKLKIYAIQKLAKLVPNCFVYFDDILRSVFSCEVWSIASLCNHFAHLFKQKIDYRFACSFVSPLLSEDVVLDSWFQFLNQVFLLQPLIFDIQMLNHCLVAIKQDKYTQKQCLLFLQKIIRLELQFDTLAQIVFSKVDPYCLSDLCQIHLQLKQNKEWIKYLDLKFDTTNYIMAKDKVEIARLIS